MTFRSIIALLVIIIAVIVALVISLGNKKQSMQQPSDVGIPTEETPLVDPVSMTSPESNDFTLSIATSDATATITTPMGDITLELFADQTPKTVENFTTLAQEGFYEGTRFHRVIDGFMIQGGDPLSKDLDQRDMWGAGGPGYQFEDEFVDDLSNVVGTISMANAGPGTNGSQFFINVADNTFLDGKHTVFGRVVEGYDIVEAISQLPTDARDRIE